jgi:protein subunit release factor B
MEKKERQLLFSVTATDCDWSYTKGSGPGGQKKNKTSSAVHCVHRDSKAHGYCEATRSQTENKRRAFIRMTETESFKQWHRLECLRRNGQMKQIDQIVEEAMRPQNIKIETKKDGKWVETKVEDLL